MPEPFTIRNPVTNKPVATFDGSGNLNLGGQATAGGQASLDGSQVLPGAALLSRPYLCTPAQYAPAVRATPNTASGTMAAVDPAHITTGTFTAPASGQVLVTASLVAAVDVGNGRCAFGLAAHGSVSPVLGNEVIPVVGANLTPLMMQFLVPGLTAGEPYSLDLLFASLDGATLTVYPFGTSSATPTTSGGPVILAVTGT